MARKIGAGALSAFGRAGLHELAQALPAFPNSGIQPVEEAGAFGNPTQQMVTEGIKSEEVNQEKGSVFRMEDPGMEQGQDATQAPEPQQPSYEDTLASYAAQSSPSQEQEMERD